MKHSLLKAFLLFISVPIINSIAFGLGTLVHDMHTATITKAQFAAYEQTMLLMIAMVAISIVSIETLTDKKVIPNRIGNLAYIAVFTMIALFTWDQFIFRPFEHSLTFASIVTILGTRVLIQNMMSRANVVSTPA